MNVYVLNTLDIGVDTTNLLIGEIPIRGMIGLSRREATDSISGYVYLREYCDHAGIDFIEVERYDLKRKRDQQRLLELKIDLLLVQGWQRLIPGWLIDHCRLGAVGCHGSAAGITAGRGRSPQNWALILGRSAFDVSIFWIDPDIDAGRVIDTRTFPLTPADDIRSSYYKVGVLTAEMVIANYRNGNLEARHGTVQSGPAAYLPQRLPDDGAIDWTRSSEQIHNFVRALTRPYPGAFSMCRVRRLYIWQAGPFETGGEEPDDPPGRVVKRYLSGDLLVATGDGRLLVTDYELRPPLAGEHPTAGDDLESVDFGRQMRTIVERHYSKYPDLKLAAEIEELAAANDDNLR